MKITLDPPIAPTITLDPCRVDEYAWNGFHVIRLTPAEIIAFFDACRLLDPDTPWSLWVDHGDRLLEVDGNGDECTHYLDADGLVTLDGFTWVTDDDPPGPARLTVTVNGRTVRDERAPSPWHAWSRAADLYVDVMDAYERSGMDLDRDGLDPDRDTTGIETRQIGDITLRYIVTR